MEGKFTLKRKEKFMNFQIKKKLLLKISGGKTRSFSTQEVGRKKKSVRSFKKWESYISVFKKNKK